jgi:hypothetical protein
MGDDPTLSIDSGEAETLAPAPSPLTPRKTPAIQQISLPRTPAASLSSSDPIGGGRFVPGQIVAERYRIVALAGRGGMGEVYRAEDLKLSQIVAIKFLPETLSKDAGALARFHSEVRVARHVSHANVCRMFDIGDADGITFLTWSTWTAKISLRWCGASGGCLPTRPPKLRGKFAQDWRPLTNAA